jgi:hypothetical protein
MATCDSGGPIIGVDIVRCVAIKTAVPKSLAANASKAVSHGLPNTGGGFWDYWACFGARKQGGAVPKLPWRDEMLEKSRLKWVWSFGTTALGAGPLTGAATTFFSVNLGSPARALFLRVWGR